MLLDQALNPTNLSRDETTTALQAHGTKPKLRRVLVALNVNVGRFLRVARVEVKPLRPGPHYGPHRSTPTIVGNSKSSWLCHGRTLRITG